VAVELLGVPELLVKLGAITKKVAAQASADVVVGYSAPYAIYVHENLGARHTTGRAKFLETAARRLARPLGNMIGGQVKAGVPIDTAMLSGAIRIKVASQALCPVRTGYLRASAYVEVRRRTA
jgi:type IV secretory pathway ATPase VirB11/archaellum biosynthesis ATPase